MSKNKENLNPLLRKSESRYAFSFGSNHTPLIIVLEEIQENFAERLLKLTNRIEPGKEIPPQDFSKPIFLDSMVAFPKKSNFQFIQKKED